MKKAIIAYIIMVILAIANAVDFVYEIIPVINGDAELTPFLIIQGISTLLGPIGSIFGLFTPFV